MAPVNGLAGQKEIAVAAKPLAEVPLEWRDGFVFVPVRINHAAPVRFLLKSGEPKSMLSKACAQELGLIQRRRAFKARLDSGWDQRWKLPRVVLGVGETHFFPANLVAGTLPASDPLAGGFLGADFFSRFVVEIDFSQARLRVYDPASYQPAEGGITVPLQLRQGLAMVPVSIDRPGDSPVRAPFFVATEYPMAMELNLLFARTNHLLEIEFPKHYFEVDTNGEYQACYGYLPRISLGSTPAQSVETMISEGAHNAIGSPFLRRFNVTFDFVHRRLLLATNVAMAPLTEPGYRPGRPFLLGLEDEFQIDIAGARLAVQGPPYLKFSVSSVTRFSPAEQAGLRRGDVVLGVDGLAPEKLTLAQWMQTARQAGRQSQLKIRRGEGILDITLPSGWQAEFGH